MRLRRLPLVLAAVAVAGAVAARLVVAGDGGTAAAPAGPTAVASKRDLVTTLEAVGTVERSWQRTVSYAAALPRPASTGGPAPESTPGDGATASTPAALTATTAGHGAAAENDTTVAPGTTDTTAPAGGTDAPGPASTTDPTAPGPASTTDTTTPAGGTTDTTTPTGTTDTTAPAGGTDPTTPAARTAATAPGPAATTPPTTAPAAPAPDGASEDDDDEDPAVLTAIAPLGSGVGNGSVLYAADDEPVVALTGTVPAWRTLEGGVDGGADVRQLEEALVALGHGADLTVDDEFTAATTAAVKRWETGLGRAEPDGVVEVGDLVFVAEPGTVLAQEAAVGDPLEAGTPVLVVGSTSQHLSATVAAGEAASWAAGSPVDLTWSDGSTTTGTVAATGREVSDGTVELTVALSGPDAARPTGAEASITTVDARREGAVAVPVAALVAGPGGTPAVRRPTAAGRPDRVVPVTTGIVAGTWVEVVTGVAPGDAVRLPG